MEIIDADVIDLVLDIAHVENCEMFGQELVHDEDCPALAAGGIRCPAANACFDAYLANFDQDSDRE